MLYVRKLLINKPSGEAVFLLPSRFACGRLIMKKRRLGRWVGNPIEGADPSEPESIEIRMPMPPILTHRRRYGGKRT